jgi:hypothetical protein
MAAIRKAYAGQVAKGQLDQATIDRRLAIEPTTDLAQLSRADFVCESASEDAALKTAIFVSWRRHASIGRARDQHVVPDVDALGEASGRPQTLRAALLQPRASHVAVEVVRCAPRLKPSRRRSRSRDASASCRS